MNRLSKQNEDCLQWSSTSMVTHAHHLKSGWSVERKQAGSTPLNWPSVPLGTDAEPDLQYHNMK